jgi:hypothetical protein
VWSDDLVTIFVQFIFVEFLCVIFKQIKMDL